MSPTERQAAGAGRDLAVAMQRLLAGARFAEAAKLYDEAPASSRPFEASRLRASIYLRNDDAPAAIGLLETCRTAKGAIAVRVTTLLGAAYAHIRDYAAADHRFAEAEAAAQRLGDQELISEVAFYRARRYAYEHRIDEARALLPIALVSTSEQIQLRSLLLEGFILDQEGRHRDEAHLLLELLRRIDPNREEFMDVRAWATDTLSYLARELYIPEALPEIERQLGGVEWPEDLNDRRFQALKALGWSCALRGDYFNAFRYLRLCTRKATDDIGRATAAAERAELLRCNGEQLWSRQELAEAEEYAESVDWKRVRDDARVVLLLLAELFAPIDPAKAAYFQARFVEVDGIKSPHYNLKDDPRLAALAQYSQGMLNIASDRRKIGIDLLKKALATFRAHSYDWRTGRCALQLYALTQDDGYLNLAREYLRHYMGSWLGDECRKLVAARPVQLPPMQRRVLDALCEGLSIPQIAQKFGRSEYTIRNHIKPLFKAFGVNRREALVAKARGR
jgi:DNA-binding CsgD family transcriptional regulator